MTGPEHYREAERLIKVVSDHPGAAGPEPVLAAAQAHATLALAAATATTIDVVWLRDEWNGVTR